MDPSATEQNPRPCGGAPEGPCGKLGRAKALASREGIRRCKTTAMCMGAGNHAGCEERGDQSAIHLPPLRWCSHGSLAWQARVEAEPRPPHHRPVCPGISKAEREQALFPLRKRPNWTHPLDHGWGALSVSLRWWADHLLSAIAPSGLMAWPSGVNAKQTAICTRGATVRWGNPC